MLYILSLNALKPEITDTQHRHKTYPDLDETA